MSEIPANGTKVSDINECSLKITCFDDVLFHQKIAIKDEAKVVDDSNKANISIAERDCLLSAEK